MARLSDMRSKLIGFMILAVLLSIDSGGIGIGERLELAVGDRMLAWHAASRVPDPDLLIVTIDERSIEALSAEFGRFPWPRSAYAELGEGLRDHAPSATMGRPAIRAGHAEPPGRWAGRFGSARCRRGYATW